MKPKLQDLFFLLVAVALLATPALAAGQPFNGQAWIGEHSDGMKYPFALRINDQNLYHNTTLGIEVHGLDLSAVMLKNNWGNKIEVTGSAPNYTLTVSAEPGNDPKYVGLSANIWATENVPLAGIGSTSVYGKIGVFATPTTKPGTVKYGNASYYQISSDNTRTVSIFVNEKDATTVPITIKPGTKVTIYVDGHQIGICANSTSTDAVCNVNAPAETFFGELPTRYIDLKVESAVTPLPSPAITIGVVP